MSFPENLARLQAERGESGYRLAKEIDVSQQSIANWRKGICIPHPKMQGKIAKHYGVSVDELMGRQNAK